MIKVIASIVTTALIIAMTLAAMFILVQATEYVTSLDSLPHRAAAMAAEIVLGIILLLGTVWLATHLAVRIFSTKEPPPLNAPGTPTASDSTGGPVV